MSHIKPLNPLELYDVDLLMYIPQAPYSPPSSHRLPTSPTARHRGSVAEARTCACSGGRAQWGARAPLRSLRYAIVFEPKNGFAENSVYQLVMHVRVNGLPAEPR